MRAEIRLGACTPTPRDPENREDKEGPLSQGMLWEGIGPKLVEVLGREPVQGHWALPVAAGLQPSVLSPSQVADLALDTWARSLRSSTAGCPASFMMPRASSSP